MKRLAVRQEDQVLESVRTTFCVPNSLRTNKMCATTDLIQSARCSLCSLPSVNMLPPSFICIPGVTSAQTHWSTLFLSCQLCEVTERGNANTLRPQLTSAHWRELVDFMCGRKIFLSPCLRFPDCMTKHCLSVERLIEL